MFTLPLSTVALLLVSGLVTSIVSATMGLVGGSLLISIMTFFFVPSVLIPLHGVVQLGSNASRLLLLVKSLNKRISLQFFLGSIVGASVGSQVLVSIPETYFRLLLGSFLLIVVWLPKFKSAPEVRAKFFILGAVVTFLSLFVGAVAPLVAPFVLREGLAKEPLVATLAACQTSVHLMKILAFGVTGFNFGPYIPFLIGMLIAVVLGSYIGKKILKKIPEGVFAISLKVIISIIAVRMIYLSLSSL